MEDMDGSEDGSGADHDVLCFKQRTEKSTGGEVILMQWSPTMDLLAAALADHSVRPWRHFSVSNLHSIQR